MAVFTGKYRGAVKRKQDKLIRWHVYKETKKVIKFILEKIDGEVTNENEILTSIRQADIIWNNYFQELSAYYTISVS